MRLLVVITIVIAIFGASAVLKVWLDAPEVDNDVPFIACGRLICLSPGITETVFALGLGDRVAGVTRFCLYPPETALLPKVGGLLDPNYEAMVALRPDVALLTPYHRDHLSELRRLGVSCLVIHQDSLAEIRESYFQLGALCGRLSEAEHLAALLDNAIEEARRRSAGKPRIRVLMTTGRDVRSGKLDEVYAVSTGTFLSELLALAGGANIIEGGLAEYPALSAEGILNLNPEVIIELVPDRELDAEARDQALAPWRAFSTVDAVRDKRLYVLSGAYLTIPGPRAVDTLDALMDCLHGDSAI